MDRSTGLDENNLCPYCELWVAQSWRQFRIRQQNMRLDPQVKVARCPQCGGTLWARIPLPIWPPEQEKKEPKVPWILFFLIIAVILAILVGLFS